MQAIPDEVFTEEFIWSFIARLRPTESGCMEWEGASLSGRRRRKGYGHLSIGRRAYAAHRVALTIAMGRQLPGLVVMHSCDNKGCCNPDHLSLGTDSDNIRDAAMKGRMPTKRPLSVRDISEIRRLRGDGLTLADIGARFDRDTACIWRICKGQVWSGVGDLDDRPMPGRRNGWMTGGTDPEKHRRGIAARRRVP